LSNDKENRLAEVVSLIASEDWVIVQNRTDVVLARNIGGSQHRYYTGSARTAARSIEVVRVCARRDKPNAPNSMPRASTMSSA
jgi:hypothetical protein